MTLPVSDTSVTYTGNNVTTIFPFGFRVDAAEHLVVTLITIASGASVIVNPANYTITGLTAPGGGSITYPNAGAPLTTAYQINIKRIVPLLQLLDIGQQSAFSPEVLEQALDYIVMMIQQLGIAGGGVSVGISTNQRTGSIIVIIDGGGGNITPGIKCDIPLPFYCTITDVIILGDQVGSVVLDIWKNTYTNFPPIGANSITAAAEPTIVNDIKYRDVILSGWNTICAAGDVLRLNLDSVSDFQRLTIAINLIKT